MKSEGAVLGSADPAAPGGDGAEPPAQRPWQHRSVRMGSAASSAKGLPRAPWGHRGYDESAVNALLSRLHDTLCLAESEVGDLHQEVQRLHRYIRQQWSVAEPAEGPRPVSASGMPAARSGLGSAAEQASAVLARAQELADRRVADADAHVEKCRVLVEDRLDGAEQEAAERLRAADVAGRERTARAEMAAVQRLAAADAAAEQMLASARRQAERHIAEAHRDAPPSARRLLPDGALTGEPELPPHQAGDRLRVPQRARRAVQLVDLPIPEDAAAMN